MHMKRPWRGNPPPEEITDAILAAFYDVHGDLKHGYLESVYRRAMLVALRHLGVRAAAEVPVTVLFRGVEVGRFRVDLVVEETVAVELKAARAIERAHEAQLLNLLRSTRLEVGLLLNFGPKPEFRRRAYANTRKHPPGISAPQDDPDQSPNEPDGR